MLSANFIPTSPRIKYSLYFRAIMNRIIDNVARIIVVENLVPPETKESAVAIMNRNISLKEK